VESFLVIQLISTRPLLDGTASPAARLGSVCGFLFMEESRDDAVENSVTASGAEVPLSASVKDPLAEIIIDRAAVYEWLE
jgi:hypothetical protein